jgi:2-desacetyl-2-hydroxyethyl bacteriochlorophyllide A dehydrogenase
LKTSVNDHQGREREVKLSLPFETMTALWLEQGRLRLRSDVPVPRPVSGQGLIRVDLAGICATDRHLMRGYYPYAGIPGHEFIGTVAAAPDAPHRVGQRVVGDINIACGQCSMCRAGRPGHCFERSVLGIQDWPGAMAAYLCLPLHNLVEVPDAIPDDAAVFAEPLAAALQIQRQVRIDPSHDVLVLGAGTLGQLIARTLSPVVHRLGVVARYESQRRSLESAGIEWLTEQEVPPHRYDCVIEASGSAQGFALAQNVLKPGGTIVLKSTFKGKVPVALSELVVNEISVIGSRCGPMDQAVEMLAARRVDPRPLIDAQYPLEEGVAAFGAAGRPGRLKVLLKMQQ